MSLNKILEEIMGSNGIDLFGLLIYIPLKISLNRWGKLVSKYPKSILIGIILPDSIVDELSRRFEREVAANYQNFI